MTAATPGQGGTHHVNLQPREYWQENFKSRGYQYDDTAVSDLPNLIDTEVADWISNNLMIFQQ